MFGKTVEKTKTYLHVYASTTDKIVNNWLLELNCHSPKWFSKALIATSEKDKT